MTASNETVPCRLCTNTLLPSTSGKTGGLCLDCFHSEKHRIEHEARESKPGCAACDGSTAATAFRFDWNRANQGTGDFRKYPKYLRHTGRVKSGERYACTVCGAPWYLDTGRQLMMLVPPSSVAAFEVWCTKKLGCSAAILDAARSIGATPPEYDDDTDDVRIPCRVTTRSGEKIDLAVLRFSRLPPIPWRDETVEKQPRFRLIDEVAAIEPSRFALPARVRHAFVLQQRGTVDRDWLSVDVVSRTGRRYRLGGRPLFFDRDGVAGEDLRRAYRSGGMSVPDMPHGPVTVFAADWFEGAKDLRIPGDPISGMVSWFRFHLSGGRS